jgi:hypothetical protein
MTADQISDYTGVAALLGNSLASEWLIADRGYGRGLVQASIERQGDTPQHPGPEVAQQGRPPRQAPIQAVQPNRDQVRETAGLAPDHHPLRQRLQDLPLRRRPRSNRLVRAVKINESEA